MRHGKSVGAIVWFHELPKFVVVQIVWPVKAALEGTATNRFPSLEHAIEVQSSRGQFGICVHDAPEFVLMYIVPENPDDAPAVEA